MARTYTAPTADALMDGTASLADYFRRAPVGTYNHDAWESSRQERKARFIEALSLEPTILDAAIRCQIPRRTIDNWRGDDPAFDQQIADILASARADRFETLESSVWKRAIAGDTLLSMFCIKREDNSYRDSYIATQQTTARQSLRFMVDSERDQAIQGEYSTVPALPAPDSTAESSE